MDPMGARLAGLAPCANYFPEVFPIAGSFGLAQIFAMKAALFGSFRFGGSSFEKNVGKFLRREKVYEYIYIYYI